MNPLGRTLKTLWLLLSLVGAAALAQTPHVRTSASDPVEKPDKTGKFLNMHQSFLARGKAGPIGVLFLGDSITEGWRKAPHIWDHFYGQYQPANFGIGGDTTQNVIWRIEHGELDGIHPKVVVLMIGTNNSSNYSGEEIAAADRKIVGMIEQKIPEAKVLLLAIFPRGARKNPAGEITDAAVQDAAKRMAAIDAANAELAKLDDGDRVRYLDIGEVFKGQDGKIPFQIMPDQLHPTAAGYELWAEKTQPLLTKMMAAQ